jgi:hypothetical protein
MEGFLALIICVILFDCNLVMFFSVVHIRSDPTVPFVS